MAAVAGVAKRSPAFWSQALTSQSAARAAGSVPPMTQPKNRPHGHQPGFGLFREVVHHLDSGGAAGRERAAEVGGEFGGAPGGADGTGLLALQPPPGVPGRGGQGVAVALTGC